MLLLEDGPGSRPPKTEAELQQEVVDKEAKRKQKVVKFWIDLSIGLVTFGGAFTTATTWYRGAPFTMVQLLYPDRNGFMPYETGFEQRLRLAQPVIGAPGAPEP